MINRRRIILDQGGIRQEESNHLSFTDPVQVVTEDVAFGLRSADLRVERARQIRFVLPFEPDSQSVRALVVDRRTYFEPDFRLDGRLLYWQRGILPLGTTLRFEVFGDATTRGHLRLERLDVTTDGASELQLDGVPVGGHAELYVDGLCYPETDAHFVISGNRLAWWHPTLPLKRDSKVHLLYARTIEGASLCFQEGFQAYPGMYRGIELAIEPRGASNARLYHQGLRYHVDQDFSLAGARLTVGAEIPFAHGDRLTLMTATSTTFFLKTSERIELPEQFFVKTQAVVDEGAGTSVPLDYVPPYREASLLSVRGSSYAQDGGFGLEDSSLDWRSQALDLKAGDDLSLLGFLRERVGDAVRFLELPVTEGYPLWDLQEKAADIRKTLVLLSATGSFGGELCLGERWLRFVDERHLQWAGPYPLKSTDRAIAVIWKDPVVAAALTVHSYVATTDEAGKPFAHRLPRAPREPSHVIAIQNGQWLASPREFVLHDDVFQYHAPDRPIKADDELQFLYR